jgi:large subunit ribosomal protein LP0
MSKGGSKKLRKKDYFKRLEGYLTTYSKVLIVTANNVGSNQLQKIRASLRGQAVLLMGKNTMIRKCIREHLAKNQAFEPLLSHIKGNIGFVFTNGDLPEVRSKLSALKVKAGAKAGTIAPCDVIVPAGPTGLEPTKTSFFQALAIQTKINKAVIEIINDVHLIKAGNKVTASQAVLLQMLNIQPFQYSLDVKTVYDDGSVYPAAMLDLTDADVLAKFRQGVTNIAALSLQVGIPTVASAPYALVNAYRDILSVALGTSYSFPAADKIKELLANPEALAAAVKASSGASTSASTSSTSTSAPATKAPEAAPAKKDVEEDEDAGMGAGGLFGGDDDEDY